MFDIFFDLYGGGADEIRLDERKIQLSDTPIWELAVHRAFSQKLT
jgi:hypothetical protein